jgi:hypothetical protein
VSRSLEKALSIRPPKELLPFLDDPPLVGDETLIEFDLAVLGIQVTAI